MTVISFRNIIVWPKRPQARAGVKLHDQTPSMMDTSINNVVVLPVISIAPKAEDTEAKYNDIQKIIAKTMRSQRYTKTSRYALEKLKKMQLNPA